MKTLFNILFAIFIIFIVLMTFGVITLEGVLIELGLPVAQFSCTNIVTCYLAEFNGTINGLYIFVPFGIAYFLYQKFTK